MEVVVTTGGIRRGKLQSNYHHQQTNTQPFRVWKPFLSTDQQCQSTERMMFPLTSTWPHLRSDVGLEEGEDKEELSPCSSVVQYYNAAQWYEQFLQVG